MKLIAFLASLALHIIVIFMSYLNVGTLFSTKIKDQGFVVFDFVEIGEKSKAPILSDIEGKASKKKSHAPDEESVNIETQPSESFIKTEDNDKKEEKINDKKTDEKNEGNVVQLNDKKKDKKKKEQKKDAKKPKNKAKNDPKSQEKALVNLRKNKKNKNPDKSAVKKSFNSVLDSIIADGDNENSGIKAEEVGEVLTATQIDLIRQTIRKCWHFPAGLKNAEDLVVDIKMELDQEGNVTKAEIIDNGRMSGDANFKIAAENAYRAVLDPKCNPLPLPKDKYNEWKELELSFNPKDMFE